MRRFKFNSYSLYYRGGEWVQKLFIHRIFKFQFYLISFEMQKKNIFFFFLQMKSHVLIMQICLLENITLTSLFAKKFASCALAWPFQ